MKVSTAAAKELGARARLALTALLLLLVAFPVVLSVYAGGTTSLGTQPPLTQTLLTPGDCVGCHGDFNATANIEPYPTWAGSMMANSARDPLFWAALDVANNDIPGVGDFCLRCHSPTGWLAGRATAPGGTPDGCSLDGAIDQADNDFEGVSCQFCHRMMENPSPPGGQQSVYFENGQYWIDDVNCTTPNGSGSQPCRRGPYDYPDGGPDSPPSHPWAFSPYHTSSGFCGNCHNVTSPAETLINESGVDTGLPFPIERTYKEWQQSTYAQANPAVVTCQNCHMPDATVPDSFACSFEENNRTGNMPIHRFVGGNTWIPAILRDEYTNLGRTADYNSTIAAATALLQTQTADVELTAPSAATPGVNMPLSVKVTNLSGHKLPTGYTEGRRMWIQVEVKDAANRVVFVSGAYNTATGDLTEDAQVKIYRKADGIWNRNGTNQGDISDEKGDKIFHFVLNNCIAIDNRIPPLGFTGGNDPETEPVDYSYPETSPGSGVLVNFDTTPYQVPVPGLLVSPLTVTTRLFYQIASKDYVEFLRNEAVTNNFADDCISRTTGPVNMSRGELMFDWWQQYGRSAPVQVDSATATVVVNNSLFADGFESGNTANWALVFP